MAASSKPEPTLPPSQAASAAAGAQTAAGPAPATSFDELDDDFEGLEDAKEGSADDDFATISRSGLDDFNPVFDSSPPPSHATKSESNLTGTTAPFGVESSFDFASLGSSTGGVGGGSGSSPPATATAAKPSSSSSGVGGGGGGGSSTIASAAATVSAATGSNAAGNAATAPDASEWDALFASLDEPAAVSLVSPATDTTTGKPAAETERPGLGRALTVEGVHDDPILKNLTSMGYSRADALSALEKYDYNLERVSSGPPVLSLSLSLSFDTA